MQTFSYNVWYRYVSIANMSQHYKWYPAAEDSVVPYNAKYSYPSQATKCTKTTPRIPPKNGADFTPTGGNPYIRLEFPANGYVHPGNTCIEFEVLLYNWGTSTSTSKVWLQNNIASIFDRARLMYGSTPIEELLDVKGIVRMLTEWTATREYDQASVAQGIGTYDVQPDPFAVRAAGGAADVTVQHVGLVNVRRSRIQGSDSNNGASQMVPNSSITLIGDRSATPAGAYSRVRYQIPLPFGLFNQEKLIPTKFMASQFAIELYLANPTDCIMTAGNDGSGTAPTYTVSNVNLIPEVLEFDDAYDEAFLKALRGSGVPLKFASWHMFEFSIGGSATVNLQVQERARSVKAMFACQKRSPSSYSFDMGATLFSSADPALTTTSTIMTDYWWRIGNRYFPSSPVICGTGGGVSGYIANGAEAYVELEKALNIIGDYRLSTGVNKTRWALPSDHGGRNEGDYEYYITNYDAQGRPTWSTAAALNAGPLGASSVGPACFAAAISLEATNGLEISGLNAEEQSDIQFIAHYAGTGTNTGNQAAGYMMRIYTYFDKMMILRENNLVQLIE